MASIPGAVFKAGKIHDEISRFRKRSASDVLESKPFEITAATLDANFRERSVSMTSAPKSNDSTPTPGPSTSISVESLRNMVGGFMGGINILRPKNVVDSSSSLESVNEDIPAMRSYPNAGSITDLAQFK